LNKVTRSHLLFLLNLLLIVHSFLKMCIHEHLMFCKSVDATNFKEHAVMKIVYNYCIIEVHFIFLSKQLHYSFFISCD